MTRKKKTQRKRKKLSKAEIRINLILISVIFGISLLLLLSKEFFSTSSLREVASSSVLVTPSHPLPEVKSVTPKVVEPAPLKPTSSSKPIVPQSIKPSPEKPIKTPEKPAPVKKPSPVVSPVSVVAPIEKPLSGPKKGMLYFVFDDAGHNLQQLEKFLRLPFPCTIAVLPGLQYSKEAAQRIRSAGKDLILHQPMQAINLNMDPGPGAIKGGMTESQIREILKRNLAEVGPVVGMNNHEGSLITADRKAMSVVLDIVHEQKIYFLDSRTNAETVVPALAREKNMTIWERAVFLDNLQEESAIIEAVYSGMKIAEKKGAAVMIGHIWSNELASILISMYPELSEQGFSLSTIAKIAAIGDDDE